MAATLIDQPYEISFNKNPMIVVLETDKITQDRAYIEIALYGEIGPVEDDSFLIGFGDTFTFVFKNTPSVFNEIATIQPGQTWQDWWLYIAEHLRQHPRIGEAFTISNPTDAGLPRIRLNWKTLEAITLSGSGTLTNMDIQAHSVTAISAVQNLSAFLSVVDATTHEEIIRKSAQYNSDTRQCAFTINDAFDDLTPTLPDPSVVDAEDAPTVAKKYYLRYADKHGLPAVTEPRMRSDTLTALAGGTKSGQRRPFFLGDILVLHDNIGEAKPVSKSQPDWLYICGKQETANYYTDIQLQLGNDTIMMYGADRHFTLEKGKAKYIPTGFNQLNLGDAIIPDDTYIAYYTVRVRKSSDNTIVYNRRYEVEAMPYHPWNTYILYDTGLGGMETVRLKGKRGSVKYEADNTIIENFEGELSTAFSEGLEKTEVSTGYYTLDYLTQLRQLLLSNAYLVIASRNPLTPNAVSFQKIIPDTKSFDYQPDDNDLHALVFSFRFAKKDTQFNHF
jgi:hypothetical protein